MQKRTIKAVEDTVRDSYLDNCKPMTVKEIREQCQLSETIIRRVVRDSPRIDVTDKQVRIMSQNYPGHVHQFRRIDAFMPTRAWLVEIIKQTRREYDNYVTGRRGR